MRLAAWTENVQNLIKYVTLNPGSKLKMSLEMRARQYAVALYFIDKAAGPNRHLQDPRDGLTARVFRTYNARVMLQALL
ncbi:hypothetical protein MG293_010334 [Ovis ammon polii]|uniref:DNA topoisomerase I catalytic core eukaryotic-type domain-containing protein n=1 Tax=Ovis ammon polii TaxID=230172 RepID=A0AAD4U8F5_OVIAM|nr:hypothetical protein MG293_010334 [Ovis ammon polii]